MDMGAMADAFAAFAQPLIDQTDGSHEQLEKAIAISQMCYNLALLSDDERNKVLAETRQGLEMDEEEFDDFQRSVIFPMIQRHHELFPLLHQRISKSRSQGDPLLAMQPEKATRGEKYPGTAPFRSMSL
jgi:hypothetical protein